MIKSRDNSLVLLCLVLTVVTLLTFWQVQENDFINFDDPSYVTANPHVNTGLTIQNILWAFSSSHASNWHPLTWISHMIDYNLYGLNPRGHHLNNLLFHIINTLLLFIVFNRMTNALWKSAFVAALFAVHPLHVEPVAWISSRKDLLSTLFWILTIWAYTSYAQRSNLKMYMIAILFFSMGLMSKPMVVTLPLILLLLDYWPLYRFNPGGIKDSSLPENNRTTDSNREQPVSRLILEKLPFFLLSAASCIITYLAQKHGGATVSIGFLPLMTRIENAFHSYLAYIMKAFWPGQLAVHYSYPVDEVSIWHLITPLIFLTCISVFIIYKIRSHRYLAVGWFWYIIALLPVIGIIQVGSQTMADRYTYIPLIGIFIMLTWGLSRLVNNKAVLIILAAATVLAFSIVSWIQTNHWKNSITLFEHTLAVDSDNPMIHNNLGVSYTAVGGYDQAIIHYKEATRLRPDYGDAYFNLGLALFRTGQYADATAQFRKSLAIDPDSLKSHLYLGLASVEAGDRESALKEYEILNALDKKTAEILYSRIHE